ncbi:MAG TPA: hypothetical protein VIW72_01710 [Burkholderiales bacterium]
MDLPPKTFLHQLKANAVAIISLFVALSGLTYNTWRDKIIEENRSVRIASFEVLKNLLGAAAGGGLRALPEKPAARKPYHRLGQGVAHQGLEPGNPGARAQSSGTPVSNLAAGV